MFPQNSKHYRRWLTVLILCVVSGCKVGPNYRAPKADVPAQFAAASPTKDAPVIDAAQWWKSLNDPELNSLIDRAIKANPQLEIALTHVQQARQQQAVTLGEALPSAEASGGAANGTGSDNTRGRVAQTLRSGENTDKLAHVNQMYGFDAGWELDLFGKFRREAEAARYSEQASEAARNDVLISIIADVVRSYSDMRGMQLQQSVLQQNIETEKQYTSLVQQRYDRGITNGLDLTLAQRQLSTLEAQIAPLGAQIQAQQFIIAVLCGEFPENMATELAKSGPLPQVPVKLQAGLPLDLLRNRPDIHEAERELAAANAHIGVATANLFPHFAITSGAGLQGQGLGISPIGQSFIWSLGPSVTIPILDFGTLDAEVNIADLQTHAMLMNYKQKVLTAVQDVDTAVSAYDSQQDRLHHLEQALDASKQAVYLATERYDRGLTDALNVVDAQRQEYDLQQQYAIARQAAADDFVAVYKALGSGWEKYQTLPPIKQSVPAIIAELQHIL